MTKEVQNQLIADHFLFKEGDRFLQHANACKIYKIMPKIFNPCSFNRSLLAIGTRDLPQCAEDIPGLGERRGPFAHHFHAKRGQCRPGAGAFDPGSQGNPIEGTLLA
jgi:hypothetical protein